MTVHLGASSFSLYCIDECVPDTVVAETQRRYHCSVVLQSQKGKTRTQSGQLSNMSHVLSPLRAGGGRERELVERPLFRSFVYVRSGRRVLGEQRSLGMLGLYSLGIICSSVVCTVFSRLTYTVGYRL